mmetsp:Transcript_122320/g.193754  ORF Transcript_122320/g.193754 Transcript_122320/m.193754 type:complete len:362 (-) Transcript_122320:3-1088(-)
MTQHVKFASFVAKRSLDTELYVSKPQIMLRAALIAEVVIGVLTADDEVSLLQAQVSFADRRDVRTASMACRSEYKCPDVHFTADDEEKLRECRRKTPLMSSTSETAESSPQEPFYLFLFTPPYSGSTALQSLVATSPHVTTLCSAGTWQCEGQWILRDRGWLKHKGDNWLTGVWNWTEVMQIYEETWSKGPEGAYIRVEKSPSNIGKISEIADYFSSKKSKAAFIVMTRSPCTKSRLSMDEWEEYSEMQARGLQILRSGGYQVLSLHYEDFLSAPCKSAERILEFLPQLRSLNPEITGAMSLTNKDHLTTGRYAALLDYALNKAVKRAVRTRPVGTTLNRTIYDLSRLHGYSELQECVLCE